MKMLEIYHNYQSASFLSFFLLPFLLLMRIFFTEFDFSYNWALLLGNELLKKNKFNRWHMEIQKRKIERKVNQAPNVYIAVLQKTSTRR